MTTTNWQDKRIVIVGAARQGLALARYLASHGAKVILNDKRTPEEMQAQMTELATLDVTWALGGHPLSVLDPAPEMVCISGGVPLDNPIVEAAAKSGIQLSNDTEIFLQAVPCKTIGITGSAGKTTTTTLVGRIASASSKYHKVWVGGNIGDPLINYLDEMQPDDLAILEISSFQSELMTTSPNVAAILNITPNHLDRHGTMDAYANAKAQVLKHQTVSDVAVLGRDDPGAWARATDVQGKLLSFGFTPLPEGQNGTWTDANDRIFLRDGAEVTRLPVDDVIELRGAHNTMNVLAACTIAYAAGFTPAEMRAGIEGFRGVPHRLEFVRTWRGAQWYNDSIATAPERTMAAVHAFGGPLILMLGGRDKNLPWEDLAKLVRQRVDHVIIFGEAAEKINTALGQRIPGSRPYSVTRVAKCEDALRAASRLAQPGFVVLFSPGGTSYDEFKDFEERGEKFRQWVLEFSETLR